MENNSLSIKPNYDKAELEKIIDLLEKIDLKRFHLQTLDKYLEEHFPSIPVGLLNIPKGTKLFRGRIHRGGPSYKEVKDYSYVPHADKANCNEFGRANFPKQSLFYASNNPDTAQMECFTKDIDTYLWFYTYGVWEAQEDLVIADILPHSNDERVLSAFAKPKEHLYNIFRQELDDYQCECVKMILDFFGRQFSKSNIQSHLEYFYSVYFADRLLRLNENDKKIDGIRYPSVPMNYRGYNTVLNFETVDNRKIKLIKTYEVVSTVYKGVLYTKQKNESTKIENDIISWKNTINYGKKENFIPADKFIRIPTTDGSNLWAIKR